MCPHILELKMNITKISSRTLAQEPLISVGDTEMLSVAVNFQSDRSCSHFDCLILGCREIAVSVNLITTRLACKYWSLSQRRNPPHPVVSVHLPECPVCVKYGKSEVLQLYVAEGSIAQINRRWMQLDRLRVLGHRLHYFPI